MFFGLPRFKPAQYVLTQFHVHHDYIFEIIQYNLYLEKINRKGKILAHISTPT